MSTDPDLDHQIKTAVRPPAVGPDVQALWDAGRGRRRRSLAVSGVAGVAALATVALIAVGVINPNLPGVEEPSVGGTPGATVSADPGAREPVEGVQWKVLSAYNGDQGVRGEATWTIRAEPCGPTARCVDPTSYAELWAAWALPGTEPPAIDLEQWVVIAFAADDDACPEEIVDVEGSWTRGVGDVGPGGTPSGVETHDVRASLAAQGYACDQPLVTSSHVLALHRDTVPTRFRFAATPGGAVEILLPVYDGPAAQGDLVAPATPEPTEVAGTFAVPTEGSAALHRLDNGSPVWVINDDDGVRVLAGDVVDVASDVIGVRSPVWWWSAYGRFTAGGSWFDARGAPVDGLVRGGVDRYEVRVRGEGSEATVEVGRRLAPFDLTRPRPAREVTIDPTRGDFPRPVTTRVDGGREVLTPIAELDQVRDGNVVLVDGSLVVDGDRPIQVCDPPGATEAPLVLDNWDGCPDDAPVPDGLTRRARTADRYDVYVGPLQVRVVGGRITEVVLTGNGTMSGARGGVGGEGAQLEPGTTTDDT